MKPVGTRVLETDRLLLRPFTVQDADAMFANWGGDPSVTAFLTWPPHKNILETQKVLNSWQDAYSCPDFYQRAICLKKSKQPVGSIGAVHEIHPKIQSAEIGYCLARAWWKKGITSEALSAVIADLFESAEMARIVCRHDINNPNSGKVMKKCGMHLIGISHKSAWNNQGVCDTALYELYHDEWREEKL